MPYNFTAHLHNYATWTAARAVQRGFEGSKTANVVHVLDEAKIIDLINDTQAYTEDSFDALHSSLANKIIKAFQKINVICSYGRAAKLIAIYTKTAVILPQKGLDSLSAYAHPPIDDILLKNLHRQAKFKHFGFNKYKWTKLNREEYLELIIKLRKLNICPMWNIERYWTLT